MKQFVFAVTAVAALGLAGCASSGGYAGGGYGGSSSTAGGQYGVCADCGTVVRIMTLDSGRSAPTATGAILGGLVGAVAGHEISSHTGGSKGNQNVSALVGAAAGAAVGNKIQDNTTGLSYDITVRMDDGRTMVVNQKNVNGFGPNSRVRVHGGKVSAL